MHLFYKLIVAFFSLLVNLYFLYFGIFKAQTLLLGAHTAFHSVHTKQALRGNVAQNREI